LKLPKQGQLSNPAAGLRFVGPTVEAMARAVTYQSKVLDTHTS